jgi:hypothetical protein
MPRNGIEKLTDLIVKNALPADQRYKLYDGGGLQLEIFPNGSRYWRFRFRYAGKDKCLALGVYPKVSLKAARQAVRDAREELDAGTDPTETKRQEKRADRDFTPDLKGALATAKIRHHPTFLEPKAVGSLMRAIDGYRGTSHVLQLRRGEIYVAGNSAAENIPAARQLRVRTRAGEVRAPGANFVVRLTANHARVTVQQGVAQLYPTGVDSPILARSGESWWLHAGAARRADPLPFDAAGWVEGVVAATNMRLADLLAELERYRRGRIACDSRVADLLVSGIYHIDDTDRALRFLAQTQSLRLNYRTRFWVVVGPAAA